MGGPPPVALARQILQSGAAGRQRGLLDAQRRHAVFDGERQPAALADQAVLDLFQADLGRA